MAKSHGRRTALLTPSFPDGSNLYNGLSGNSEIPVGVAGPNGRHDAASFFYGWIIIAVTFVTMAIGVNARTAQLHRAQIRTGVG
ncbi:MAG: hypothetical protein QOF07_328 [Bradyrhizobium sp.]|nr:hypothetical protein [Bradyrhizobium sp.]